MPSQRDSETDPHPETLVWRLLGQGDPEAALEVCARWRERDPANPRIIEVEAAVSATERPEATGDPFNVTEAEMYVQKGYLDEGLVIYRHLTAAPDFAADPEVLARVELLTRTLAFALPEDASPQLQAAEEQVRQRHLPMALLAYHEFAQSSAADDMIKQRRDQLRSLLVDMPSSAVTDDVAALGDTITESVERSLPSPEKKRHRLAARTERSLPPVGARIESPDEEPPAPARRGGMKTEIDIPLQECFRAIEKARTARSDDEAQEEGPAQDSWLPSPTAPSERQIPVPEPLITPHEEHSSSVPAPPVDVSAGDDELLDVIDDRPPRAEYVQPLRGADQLPRVESAPRAEPVEFIDDRPPRAEVVPPLRGSRQPPMIESSPDVEAPDVIDDGPRPIEDGPPRRGSEQPPRGEPRKASWQEPAPVEPSHTSWLEPLIDDPPPSERAATSGEPSGVSWNEPGPDESSLDDGIEAAEPFSSEWLEQAQEKKRKKRRGPRTEPGISPMVVPQDETGRSVVEVPRDVPSVMERVRGRMSAADAAAHAEPLGVVVRTIVIVE